MDAPLILIADSDPAFRQALKGALQERYRVRCCGTGTEALTLLGQFCPELLVLDLMLPELDGFRILQAVSERGACPKVLATTLLSSNFILETAEALSVDYLMRKPCDIPTVAMRVEELLCRTSAADLTKILQSLGFTESHLGCRFLPVAARLAVRNPGQSMTKELYPEVGKLCRPKASAEQVEKNIRSAISEAWGRGEREAWLPYFPDGRRPTNRVFILKMAELLKVRGVN